MNIKKTLVIVLSSLILIWIASLVPALLYLFVKFNGTTRVVILYSSIAIAYSIPYVIASMHMNVSEEIGLMNRSVTYLLIITGLYTIYSVYFNPYNMNFNSFIETFLLTFFYLLISGGVGYLISYGLMKTRMKSN